MRMIWRRLWYVLRQHRRDAELAEELEAHRAMAQRDLEARGLPPAEAAVTASRAFGSAALARDRARDVWIAASVQGLSQDVRIALRLLARDRRFTLAAIVALGLGIGVTNTIFTLINTTLIRDLPFDRADQLVSIGTRDTRNPRGATGASARDLQEWRAASQALSAIAATGPFTPMNLSDDDRMAERFQGTTITVNTFGLLGRAPLLGRDFASDDERPGAPAVVMLGHGVWTRRYGADPSIVGRTIRVNGTPAIVVGVMPPGFRFPGFEEIWLPMAATGPTTAAGPMATAGSTPDATRGARVLSAFGRVADGVDLARARTDLDLVAARLARAYPDTNTGVTITVAPLKERYIGHTRQMLYTLLGTVVLVLLIACANVTNLLLARAASRAREMAIRAAIGAPRWRLVRQVLVECLLIAIAAGGLGLLLSRAGVQLLAVAFDGHETAAPAEAVRPYWVDLSVNAPVFLFVAGLCLAASVLIGIVPAWHISRGHVTDLLNDSSRTVSGAVRARRWTNVFMIGQVALTLVLLTAAGLLGRSYLQLAQADRVIDTSQLVSARIALPEETYRTPEQRARFFRNLDARLAVLPAAGTATVVNAIPFTLPPHGLELTIEHDTGDIGDTGNNDAPATTRPIVATITAGERYFETLALRVQRGRAFVPRDSQPGLEGAIINQRAAAVYFPGIDPIGRRIRLTQPAASGSAPGGAIGSTPAADAAGTRSASSAPPGTSAANPRALAPASPWFTIAGIVPSLPEQGPERTAAPAVYVPLGTVSAPRRFAALIARSSHADTGTMIAAMRAEVARLDRDLPLYSIETLDAVLQRSRTPQQLIGTWFALLAGIALLLSAVGLYALTAHGVTQRTQEIGVRMALGARTGEVVWLFLRRTLIQLAIGLALGLTGALMVGRLLQSLLVMTGARDPITIIVVMSLLVVVALLACLVPARRAARLDPVAALRNE